MAIKTTSRRVMFALNAAHALEAVAQHQQQRQALALLVRSSGRLGCLQGGVCDAQCGAICSICCLRVDGWHAARHQAPAASRRWVPEQQPAVAAPASCTQAHASSSGV
jgi:hypothetical protein